MKLILLLTTLFSFQTVSAQSIERTYISMMNYGMHALSVKKEAQDHFIEVTLDSAVLFYPDNGSMLNSVSTKNLAEFLEVDLNLLTQVNIKFHEDACTFHPIHKDVFSCNESPRRFGYGKVTIQGKTRNRDGSEDIGPEKILPDFNISLKKVKTIEATFQRSTLQVDVHAFLPLSGSKFITFVKGHLARQRQ